MAAFDPGRIPDNLKQAYREKRCAVLVGAGASMGAGLPSWGTLLSSMIDEARGHRVIDDAKVADYRKLVADPSKYLMVAGGLKEDFAAYFDEFVVKTFIEPKPRPTELHQTLTKADRLQFVLTTNYDTLLEQAYRASGMYDVAVCTFLDSGEIQRRLSKREFFILKAHGDASRVGNGIVLTEMDYRDIVYRQRAYQSLLSAMFTMFTIIFVGASMTDPEIKLLLSYISDVFATTSGPSHFALMAEEDTTGVERERWFKDMKVQLVPVSKANDYEEVTQFIEALHASA
ncbi:SIR2 family protein [Bradyrhizobium sp. SZCCHNRI20481]|uniref:SIR2 family protein n=1 Tax=Bradyrhizobium sp. SZCCHNRI20481 TaxID=3057286 RepID=UPI002915F960|nr:SIR2 family protein [Bradyrhizobium sp. SZCCHNRI20481]